MGLNGLSSNNHVGWRIKKEDNKISCFDDILMAVEVQLISFSNVAKRHIQFIRHLVGTVTSVKSIMCKNLLGPHV